MQDMKLEDRWWRLNNLYTIMSKSGAPVVFRLNHAQEELYLDMYTPTWSSRHTKTVVERLNKNIFPFIGDKAITGILPRDIA